MASERNGIYKDAVEIAKTVIAASNANAAPNKETADNIADFIETLVNRLSGISDRR